MNFDFQVKELGIEYGVILGNEKIVFIKCGLLGSLRGYHDKYLKVAKKLNKEYGYTVVCSTNPDLGKIDQLQLGINFITNLAKDNNLLNFEIYYMGNSLAGMYGAKYGYLHQEIKKMLLINAPLLKNVDLLLSGLRKFNGTKAVLVYGEYDPSFKNTELLNLVSNDKVFVEIIKNADHNFTNQEVVFENLIFKYLL